MKGVLGPHYEKPSNEGNLRRLESWNKSSKCAFICLTTYPTLSTIESRGIALLILRLLLIPLFLELHLLANICHAIMEQDLCSPYSNPLKVLDPERGVVETYAL